MTDTVLFDLDGTLLNVDMDVFTNEYFGRFTRKMAPHGYDPKAFVDMVWAGTRVMVKNDGNRTNEEAFWRFLEENYSPDVLKDRALFEEYYENEFEGVREVCGLYEDLPQVLQSLKDRGFRIVLATNPLFPDTATRRRAHWAGIDVEDFEYYTTYENSTYCKPNPMYYRELLGKLNLSPERCLMVGNDVEEDILPTLDLGMRAFLLPDHEIDRGGADRSRFPHGDYAALKEFLAALPAPV